MKRRPQAVPLRPEPRVWLRPQCRDLLQLLSSIGYVLGGLVLLGWALAAGRWGG